MFNNMIDGIADIHIVFPSKPSSSFLKEQHLGFGRLSEWTTILIEHGIEKARVHK